MSRMLYGQLNGFGRSLQKALKVMWQFKVISFWGRQRKPGLQAKHLEAFLSLAAEQEPQEEMTGLGGLLVRWDVFPEAKQTVFWKSSSHKLHLKELKNI